MQVTKCMTDAQKYQENGVVFDVSLMIEVKIYQIMQEGERRHEMLKHTVTERGDAMRKILKREKIDEKYELMGWTVSVGKSGSRLSRVSSTRCTALDCDTNSSVPHKFPKTKTTKAEQ